MALLFASVWVNMVQPACLLAQDAAEDDPQDGDATHWRPADEPPSDATGGSTPVSSPSSEPNATPTPVGSGEPIEPDNDNDNDNDENVYPIRFGARPLTMPRRMLRVDGSFSLLRFSGEPTDFASIVHIGVAYGVTDWLELSITDQQIGRRRLYAGGLLPMTFNGGFNFGDLYASARFRFVRGPRFTMGVDVGFVIPTDTEFAILTALPFRIRTESGVFTLDGSLEVGLFFGEGVVFSTPLTLAPRVSPIEALTLGIDTGFYLGDAFEDNRVTMPLGFDLSYTIAANVHRIDAFANFTMPEFLRGENVSGTRERSVQTDLWALTVGVRSYLDLR